MTEPNKYKRRDTSDDEPDERRDSERDTIELEPELVRAIEMATD
jgi:hypothetical protein